MSEVIPATLSPQEVLALCSAVGKNDIATAKSALSAGKYTVDLTVRLQGELSVGKPGLKKSTVSIPVKGVIGLLLQRAGCTREASVKLIREAVTLTMNKSDDGTEGATAFDEYVSELFEEATDSICESLPKTPTSGRTSAKLTCTVVR